MIATFVDRETFGKRLTRVLLERGKTVYALAKSIGKPAQTVRKWADGETEPGAFSLAKAERELRLPHGYLVDDYVDDALPAPTIPDEDPE